MEIDGTSQLPTLERQIPIGYLKPLAGSLALPKRKESPISSLEKSSPYR